MDLDELAFAYNMHFGNLIGVAVRYTSGYNQDKRAEHDSVSKPIINDGKKSSDVYARGPDTRVSGARLSCQLNYTEIVAAASKHPFTSIDINQISISSLLNFQEYKTNYFRFILQFFAKLRHLYKTVYIFFILPWLSFITDNYILKLFHADMIP